MSRLVNDLVRIAAAGGGFTVNASNYTINDLVRIAAAASNNKSRIHIINCQMVSTNDLVRIASAGSGAVVFDI